ncbi:UNVERIFIED_CONTAM: protein NETWORKED 1D [Sesamum radiatum]|uniref:Protein NETWORKED 1D n=1 Tax=Sesamum radiatum TaxID=300843 RepID=A0AAW2UUG5_SESRA
MHKLEDTNKNLEKLSEKNRVLENSLSDVHHQLEALMAKSQILEDSCQLLVNEKAGLKSENDGLTSQLEKTQIKLEDLERLYGELEGRCINLEKENESSLLKVEELQMSLNVERQEHASYVQMNETRFSGAETEIHLLQAENERRKIELDQMLDNAIDNEINIFVLRITAQEMKENNCSLHIKNQKLLEESSLSEKKISQLKRNNFDQQDEIKSLSDQFRSLRAGTYQLLKVLDIVQEGACEDKFEQDQVIINQLLDKLQSMKKSLCEAEEENLEWTVELSVLLTWIRQLKLDSQNLELERSKIEHEFKVKTQQVSVLENEALTLLEMNEELRSKLTEGECNREALMNQIEDLNRKLMDMQALETLSLIFRSFADEKCMALRELGDDRNKLHDINAALMGKLSLTEGSLEESKTETLHLEERLQKTQDELKVVATAKDQLSVQIENGKKLLHKMALELQEAEEKISLVEIEKLELNKSVENVNMEYNEVKMARDQQENQILKLSVQNDNLSRENYCLREASQKLEVELHELQSEHNNSKIQEENLQIELQKKIGEINELETRAASVFGQLQYSLVSQLLYEQRFHELHEACLGYVDQNEDLKTQLVAFGPEIASLKECISSLENHTDIHIKFQNPENEQLQDAQVTNDDKKALMPSTFSDLHDLRIRLQAIVKAAVEIKEVMVQENNDLRSKLDASVSDGPSQRYSKTEPADMDNQIVELWETADLDGTVGLTIGKTKKTVSPSSIDNTDFHHVKSIKKQKGVPTSDSLIEKELSIDKLEISKRSTDSLQEGNKRKVLERLDSDVQKLANLQITVQDLKRKLEVTEQGKRGKAVIECEALKGQLGEADMAIMKLFDISGRLMKSIDNRSFSDSKSSLDLEDEGSSRRRKVSEQARRMSEKIGRLQLEVQKLQFSC